MSYSYQRTAAEKTYYDLMMIAQAAFINGLLKNLLKQFKGSWGNAGAFGSGSFTFDNNRVIRFGFKGGEQGMLYVLDPYDRKTEHSVINHTPASFVKKLINSNIFKH